MKDCSKIRWLEPFCENGDRNMSKRLDLLVRMSLLSLLLVVALCYAAVLARLHVEAAQVDSPKHLAVFDRLICGLRHGAPATDDHFTSAFNLYVLSIYRNRFVVIAVRDGDKIPRLCRIDHRLNGGALYLAGRNDCRCLLYNTFVQHLARFAFYLKVIHHTPTHRS